MASLRVISRRCLFLQELCVLFHFQVHFICGNIRLICNPELSSDDIELIAHGVLIDEKRATNDLFNNYSLEEISADDEIKMDIISNLIENGRLKIKVAFMNDGIYHEKFGIFTDKEDEMVYFNGSANETKSAKKKNFESFMVTESWESDKTRRSILNEKEYFEKLWNNEIDDDSLIVYDFPVALKEKIFKDYKVSPNIEEAIQSGVLGEAPDIAPGATLQELNVRKPISETISIDTIGGVLNL